MRVRFSLMALFNYDNTIFEDWTIPDDIDPDILMPLLLTEAGDLNLIYPDPDMFKMVSTAWTARKSPIWERLLKTTQIEYNPIENYNRTEVENVNQSRTGSENQSSEDSVTRAENRSSSGTNTGNVTMDGAQNTSEARAGVDTDDGSDTISRTGYNSSTYQATEKTDKDYNRDYHEDRNESNTVTNKESRNLTSNEMENTTGQETQNGNRTTTHNSADMMGRSLHAYGNIGVTTAQSMIKQERDVSKFDIYSVIIDDFIDYFCVGVY